MKHALLHWCRSSQADKHVQWESQMAQVMREAQVIRRDGQGRSASTIQWRDISDTAKTKMAMWAERHHGRRGRDQEEEMPEPLRDVRTERIHMHYSIVLAASVHRPSQLSPQGLVVSIVSGIGRPQESCSTESMG